MDLRTYTSSTAGAASAMAAELGVTRTSVSEWASGRKRPAPERCVEIEQATSGSVMRWDLCPADWHKIWPELRQHPDAPPIPTSSADPAGTEGQGVSS